MNLTTIWKPMDFSFSGINSRMKELTQNLDRRFDLVDSIWNGLGRFEEIDPWFNIKDNQVPPYDVEKIEGGYKIDMALAGSKKEDIKISIIDEKRLKVSVESMTKTESIHEEASEAEQKLHYAKLRDKSNRTLHTKLSRAAKEVTFSIIKGTTVSKAVFENGMLTIILSTPEIKKDDGNSIQYVNIE